MGDRFFDLGQRRCFVILAGGRRVRRRPAACIGTACSWRCRTATGCARRRGSACRPFRSAAPGVRGRPWRSTAARTPRRSGDSRRVRSPRPRHSPGWRLPGDGWSARPSRSRPAPRAQPARRARRRRAASRTAWGPSRAPRRSPWPTPRRRPRARIGAAGARARCGAGCSQLGSYSSGGRLTFSVAPKLGGA